MDLVTFFCLFFILVILVLSIPFGLLTLGSIPITLEAKEKNDEDEDSFFYSAMYLSQND
tara:strand:- start:698 stop:874 length:177 start_codon:yes stop_codon:yes gene_type:complete